MGNAAPGRLALLITQYSGKALTLRIRAKPSAVLNLIMESILRVSPTVSLFRFQTMQTVEFVDSILGEFSTGNELIRLVFTCSAEMLNLMFCVTRKSE